MPKRKRGVQGYARHVKGGKKKRGSGWMSGVRAKQAKAMELNGDEFELGDSGSNVGGSGSDSQSSKALKRYVDSDACTVAPGDAY